MKAVIYKSAAKGTVNAPPSKSMAHRLLICAGLAAGESLIKNVELSEDIKATMDCLRALGADCVYDKGTVTVKGTGAISPVDSLNCRECGSTLRFFLPVCLLSDKRSLLTGSPRLMERPMDVYEQLCMEKGYLFGKSKAGITVRGTIKSGVYTLRGDVSSQFISGLLFALPLAEGDSTIKLTGKTESKPYIDMTLSALTAYGVSAYWRSEAEIYIKGSQSYKSTSLMVEGDYSNAAFLSAFNLIGGNVEVKGLSENSLQGDRVYGEYFEALKNGAPRLDIANCPDLGPVLFAMAAALGGGSFTGTARLKMKESDRGAAMAAELAKLGVDVDIKENEIRVSGGIKPPAEVLNGHNDHRIVMALSVLLSACGGEIEGAEAVAKSMPHFFTVIKQLGVECDLYE